VCSRRSSSTSTLALSRSASTPSTNCWPTCRRNRSPRSLGHDARVCPLLAWRPPRCRIHPRHPHGLVDLKTGEWASGLFRMLNLPSTPLRRLFALEPLLAGAGALALSMPSAQPAHCACCHDTASASREFPPAQLHCYICSGTWSLVGTLTDAPVTTREAFDAVHNLALRPASSASTRWSTGCGC